MDGESKYIDFFFHVSEDVDHFKTTKVLPLGKNGNGGVWGYSPPLCMVKDHTFSGFFLLRLPVWKGKKFFDIFSLAYYCSLYCHTLLCNDC